MLESLVRQAQELPAVSLRAAREFERRREALTLEVSRDMATHPTAQSLIGRNPLSVMFESHAAHAGLMAAVVRFGCHELLARGHAWFHRVYRSRGFRSEYFPFLFRTWIKAVGNQMDAASAGELAALYGWLVERHQEFAELAREPQGFGREGEGKAIADEFLALLMRGETAGCLRQAREFGSAPNGLDSFYLRAVQPAMREIGKAWEDGRISAAEEHLATGIVTQAMAAALEVATAGRVVAPREGGLHVVVACAPGDLHALGARMVADLLSLDGWSVAYLGADVPERDLLGFLRAAPPHLLALSVAVPANLVRLERAVAAVKGDGTLRGLKVMVGGQAFEMAAGVAHQLGADGWARDARSGVALARQWRGGDRPGRSVHDAEPPRPVVLPITSRRVA